MYVGKAAITSCLNSKLKHYSLGKWMRLIETD
jgi:hypothetical protein